MYYILFRTGWDLLLTLKQITKFHHFQCFYGQIYKHAMEFLSRVKGLVMGEPFGALELIALIFNK